MSIRYTASHGAHPTYRDNFCSPGDRAGSDLRAEDLKQRQATIKGMVVRHLDNGKFTGLAVGIVATAGKEIKNGKVTIQGKIGDSMKSALAEAERYVRVQHADLGNADIVISFEERYAPKDGGSAGTAFSVLLRSLTEGFEIDPNTAITGDIAVNGKVMPIGGVTAKLRGVMTDGCTVAVIPADNIPAVGDLLVRGNEMMEILRGLQVFSVTKVDESRRDYTHRSSRQIEGSDQALWRIAERHVARRERAQDTRGPAEAGDDSRSGSRSH